MRYYLDIRYIISEMADELSKYDREIFKSSILANASSIILMHNHPSGTVQPSEENILVTKRVKKCGDLLGIGLTDHIIIGGTTGEKFSFRGNGGVGIKKGRRWNDRNYS